MNTGLPQLRVHSHSQSALGNNFVCMLLLSHFSRVQLCVTPQTAAHEAPPSLGFSRQEYWSGVPLPFEPPSHLPPNPTPIGWYRIPVWVSWAIKHIPVGYLFYIWSCKFPCYSFHTSHPLLPCPHVHDYSLCLFLHCCPVNKFFSTIFLDSVYMR